MNTKTYSFSELSEEAKRNALEKYYDINIFDDWDTFLLEEFKNQLEFASFYEIKIEYSGFGSQGDGLSFTGGFDCWYFNKTKAKEINFESIKNFIKYIQNKHCFFEIERFSHRYYHENTVTVKSGLHEKEEENILSFCQTIMQEFYSLLENEYCYLTSEAQIIEAFENNEYIFDENGELI